MKSLTPSKLNQILLYIMPPVLGVILGVSAAFSYQGVPLAFFIPVLFLLPTMLINLNIALAIVIFNLAIDLKTNTAITVSNGDVVVGVAFLAMLFHVAIKKKPIFKNIDPAILVFLFISVITVLYSPNMQGALSQAKGTIEAVLLFIITLYSITRLEDVKRIVKYVIATAIFAASLGILQHFTGGFGWTGWEFSRGYLGNFFGIGSSMVRLANGGFYHFNALGQFLGLTVPLLVAMKQSITIRYGRLAYNLLCLIGLSGLIFTYSRGALGSLIFSLLLIVLLKRKDKIVVGTIVFIFGTMIVLMALVVVLDNQSYLETFSVGLRFNIWKYAMIEITQSIPRILFGFGQGSFTIVTGKYAAFYNVGDVHTVWQAHNAYILLWFEMGLVGLLNYLYIIGTYFKKVLTFDVSGNIFVQEMFLGIFAGLMSFMVQSIVDHALMQSQFKMIIFLYLALIRAVLVLQKENLLPLKTGN